jgi:Bacterial mobilisation protein (MobC)
MQQITQATSEGTGGISFEFLDGDGSGQFVFAALNFLGFEAGFCFRFLPEAINALAFQLAKIGTNLNQLAHIANETRALRHEAELRMVADRIVAALDKVMAL